LTAAAQIVVRRGDDAHVERDGPRRAHRSHLALGEHAQELRLQREREVSHLVEQQRAALRLHEQPSLVRTRIGERALDVTEQLALEQRVRHRGHVDRHEGLGRAARALVQGPVRRALFRFRWAP
jgi:hypothetical protein